MMGDFREEDIEIERLGQEIIGPCLSGSVLRAGMGGEQNDRNGFRLLLVLEEFDDFPSVFPGEQHIDQQEVRAPPQREVFEIVALVRCCHLISLFFQDGLKKLENIRIVVYHEDALGCSLHCDVPTFHFHGFPLIHLRLTGTGRVATSLLLLAEGDHRCMDSGGRVLHERFGSGERFFTAVASLRWKTAGLREVYAHS